VISVLHCRPNPNPPFNLLIGHAKFVSMNMFLVWQDRALSVPCPLKDVVCWNTCKYHKIIMIAKIAKIAKTRSVRLLSLLRRLPGLRLAVGLL